MASPLFTRRRTLALLLFVAVLGWFLETQWGGVEPRDPCEPDSDCWIPYEYLASEETDPYLVFGEQPTKRAEIWAARRWPDMRSCLVRKEQSAEMPDIARMNWSKLRSYADIEVCLFRVAASIRSPEGMGDWFRTQKLQRVSLRDVRKIPNVYPGDMKFVGAGNSFSGGTSYRRVFFPFRFWRNLLSRGETFSVLFKANGDVFNSDYFDANVL